MGHVLGRQAELAGLVLGDIDAQHLAGFVPVKDGFADVGVGIEHGGQVNRVLAHQIDVRPADPVLQRLAHWRPQFQGMHKTADAHKVLAQAFVQPFDQGVAAFQAFADNHQLGVEGVLQLLIERQVETDRAFTDVRAPAHDIVIALERFFKTLGDLERLLDRGVLRQVQVHQNLGAVGGREKLVLHQAHAKYRQHKHQHCRANGRPAITHAPQQRRVEGLGQTPGFLGLGFDLGAEDMHAQHRREQHRHHPRHQHGHGNHRKQGEGVLPRRAVVQADGHKPCHGHQRTGEHRERRGVIGKGGRLLLGFPQFEPRDHHLHRDHRIVHQQAQGDDQRTQRHTLHGDAGELHKHEHQRQHQRNRDRHHQPGTQAQADKAHRQYDHHGLKQRTGKAADGHLHHLCLIGDHVHANTHRQLRGQVVDALLQLFAEFLNIAAIDHGDGKANGRLAVVMEHGRCRIHITAGDFSDIGQAIKAIVDPQVHRSQVFNAVELPRGAHRHALRPGLDHPGGGHGVLFLQAFKDVLLVKAKGRQFAGREVQVERFVLLADGHHLAAIGYIANAGTHLLYIVAQLTHGEAVAGEGEDGAVDIAELIVKPRALNALGEVAANVADLFAHLIPDMGDGIGLGGVLEEHKHRGLTGAGVALYIVEGVQLFELFLDAVGDLQTSFVDRSTGPFGLDDHGLDGEGRVFSASEIDVRKNPGDHRDKHQIPDK